MTTVHRIMMTPTDKSIPAVRITSVWATPRMAMMVTCCSTTLRFSGARNLPGAAKLKITAPIKRTMKGMMVGKSCRKAWMRRTSPASVSSKLATAVVAP